MSNDIKNIEAPSSLGDVMLQINESENNSGLDRVRNVLAVRMNQYNDIALTKNDVRRLKLAFQNIEIGTSTNLVQICSKDNCLYKNRCPFFEDDKCPEGKECIHENYMLTYILNQYLESLEVDINNMPEMVLINQLTEYELLEYRCNAILSNSHTDLKWTRVVGLDKQGEIVESEEISYALTIKMQVSDKKFRLLQSFTATREAKYKKQAALKESKEGPSKMLANMKNEINKKRLAQIDHNEVKEKLINPMQDEDLINIDEME